MRLATATRNGSSAVFAATDGGFVAIPELMRKTTFADARDVGELLGAGDDVLESVRSAVDASSSTGVPLESLALLPPVRAPKAIVCVGRNYADHVAEGGVPLPAEPLLFAKFGNTLAAHPARVPYPPITRELDYEGELALVIGRRAAHVAQDHAFEHIAGYTVVNDISARDLQNSDMQWIRGKSLDAFAPIGPCVVTRDEIPDPYRLSIRTHVNDELRQDALVGEMHFRIPALLEFITQCITLEPGDIVATGTPAGVGLGFDPPRYLDKGDVVTVTIDPIGSLRAEIV